MPNLAKLDRLCSIQLIVFKFVWCSPNLKGVELIGCGRMPHVDPSIFSPHKLEYLNVSGCMLLKSLSNNICSQSLKAFLAWNCINLQEFLVTLVPSITSALHLWFTFGWWDFKELPSSILHMKNFQGCCFPMSDNLMDLPENFPMEFGFMT